MLSLDQVRLLENRVEKAVGKITSLTDENTRLRSQISGLQTRVNELEGLVRSFKDDQGRIEEGILSALDRLSAFEDSVFHSESKMVSPVSEEAPHDTILSETNVPTEDIVDNSISISLPEAANDQDSSASIQIEAEWQNAPAKPSTDGQMDIF